MDIGRGEFEELAKALSQRKKLNQRGLHKIKRYQRPGIKTERESERCNESSLT